MGFEGSLVSTFRLSLYFLVCTFWKSFVVVKQGGGGWWTILGSITSCRRSKFVNEVGLEKGFSLSCGFAFASGGLDL